MALIDISPAFQAGMPGWPGDTPFQAERSWAIGPGCPVNVSRITLSSHVGAHADAPLHFEADGRAIDAMPLERYIGPCHLVDARGGDGPIQPERVLPALPAQVERVLIRQYEHYPETWDAGLRGLSPALVEALADRGCRLIGVDAASVDPTDSKTLDAHHAIERRGIAIIEGLVLDHVAPGPYELIAPPLRIAGCDAAPLRAVLRTL
ncbi:arylformamidase [Rhabdaerophilum sp.]|uniref:arylformamidase n=1 Tax=Rhabdaerophilum sp. TaxID=2717341 RepID=UPI0038D469AD